MPAADQLRGNRERDKLTVAKVCADLGISLTTAEQGSPLARRPYDLRH
jgi:hypothetical protein